MRIVSTIKFIAEWGLAFRGTEELIASQTSGNYLGILELLSEYDPFLAAHIKLHANKGWAHTNDLFSLICEEVIGIMDELVLKERIARIKNIMKKSYGQKKVKGRRYPFIYLFYFILFYLFIYLFILFIFFFFVKKKWMPSTTPIKMR